MKNNPWNLPDGTKLQSRYGGEFQYCYDNGEWKLYNPWSNSYYDLDQKYLTERDFFEVVERWRNYDRM